VQGILRSVFWGVLIVASTLVHHVEAEPSLVSGRIRYGSSIRAPENAWAIFAYRLENPDPEPTTVRIQLRPDRQRGGVIYDHDVTIPAEAVLINEIPITTTRDDKYVADLFFQGNLIETTEMLITTALPSERVLMVLNDSDVGIGSLSRNDNLHGKYKTSPVGAQTAPENWAGYDRVTAVVAVRPNWERFTARQSQALHDYVERGGTLLMVDPVGAEAMSHTQIGHLLPATPLRLRPIDAVTLENIPGAQNEAHWPDGVDFLETEPLADTLITRELDGYPLVCWHRYGLGRVVLSSAHPSRDGIPHDMRDAWWRHLLRFSGSGMVMQSSQGSRPLGKAVDTLTGLQIPSRGPIMTASLGYLALAALIIFIGIATRRRITSWIALSLISIVATVVTFVIASRQHENRAARSASLIAFGDENTPNEQIISLFSRNETRLTLAAESAESRFRDVPAPPRDTRITTTTKKRPTGPPGGAMKPGKIGSPGSGPKTAKRSNVEIRDPLNVTMREGKPHLEDALLRGNSVRMHAVLKTGSRLEANSGLPTLPAAGEGSWQIPVEFAAATGAAVLLESGFSAATIEGQSVNFKAGQQPDLKPPAADLEGIRQAVADRKLPTPALLLSRPLSGVPTDYGLPSEFELSGRTINLIPMQESLVADTDLPWGRMPVRPDGGLARALHSRDGWMSMQQRTIASSYELITRLPHSLLRLEVNTIRIHFAAENRGLNVDFEIMLRPFDADSKDKSRDLKASSAEDDVWTFDVAANSDLFDPSDGRLKVVLIASPIKKIIDPVAQQRANTWTVRRFEAAVSGKLAPQWSHRRPASKDAP
jgi:hypothetical protein